MRLGIIASAFKGLTLPPAGGGEGPETTFNPALDSAWWTLSGGNQIATKSTGGDTVIPLQYFGSAGQYWDEYELTASSNVEFQGVGVGSASCPWTTTGTYPGQTGTFNSGVYWRGAGVWEYAYNDVTTQYTGLTNLATGAVICILTKMSTRKFFVFARPAGGGAGSWIGDDPNVTPAGGFDFGVSGDICPFWYSYYNNTVTTHRSAAAQTEFANAPSGTTQVWRDNT